MVTGHYMLPQRPPQQLPQLEVGFIIPIKYGYYSDSIIDPSCKTLVSFNPLTYKML